MKNICRFSRQSLGSAGFGNILRYQSSMAITINERLNDVTKAASHSSN